MVSGPCLNCFVYAIRSPACNCMLCSGFDRSCPSLTRPRKMVSGLSATVCATKPNELHAKLVRTTQFVSSLFRRAQCCGS